MFKLIRETKMAAGFIQARGAICLVEVEGNKVTPYATFFRNDEDSDREGRPCYYSGDYFHTRDEAEIGFAKRERREDPTGQLRAAAVLGHKRIEDAA